MPRRGASYHIKTDLSPNRNRAPDAKHEVSTWGGTLAGWNVLREQRELGALVLVNSAFSFISAMVLITILQQIVVKVDLNSVHLLVNTLTKFISMVAPKPPVFEIKTLAFGLLMAAIGLGLGLGVAVCGASKMIQPQQGAALYFAGVARIRADRIRHAPRILARSGRGGFHRRRSRRSS